MPEPKYQSAPYRTMTGVIVPKGAAQFERRQKALTAVRKSIEGKQPPSAPVEADGPYGRDADAITRLAGLAGGWAAVRARAVSLGLAVPGYVRMGDTEQLRSSSCEALRAWAYEYAPDLIDPAAEQHDEAATVWGWW